MARAALYLLPHLRGDRPRDVPSYSVTAWRRHHAPATPDPAVRGRPPPPRRGTSRGGQWIASARQPP